MAVTVEDPARRSKILQALEPQAQREIVTRIAKMREVSPEVIRRTEEALRQKVKEQGEIVIGAMTIPPTAPRPAASTKLTIDMALASTPTRVAARRLTAQARSALPSMV